MKGNIATLARTLRIPASRLYNAASECGWALFRNQQQVKQAVLLIQRRYAVPFTSLAELFGDEVTLAEMAKLEAKEPLVVKK